MRPQATPGRPWKAIAAMAENRVIGIGNRLPWHIPEDFQWVKQATAGQAVAMGYKTFLSLGKPLPDRQNIVLSRSQRAIPGCVVLPSLEALENFPIEREIWIFGGAQIYAQALNRVHALYLTVVRGNFAGDTWFPLFEDSFELKEILRDEPAFSIRLYTPRDQAYKSARSIGSNNS